MRDLRPDRPSSCLGAIWVMDRYPYPYQDQRYIYSVEDDIIAKDQQGNKVLRCTVRRQTRIYMRYQQS